MSGRCSSQCWAPAERSPPRSSATSRSRDEVDSLLLLDLDGARRRARRRHTAAARRRREASTPRDPVACASARGLRRARQRGQLPGEPGRDGRVPRGRLPLHRPRRPLLDDRPAARARRSSSAPGLLALLGMGSSPGKTNVMAAARRSQRAAARAGSTRCDVIGGRAGPRPAAGLQRPLRAADAARRADDAAVVVRDGRAGGDRAAGRRRGGRLRRADRQRARRSTRSTPSCAPSPTASAAARRASGSRCRPAARAAARAGAGARRRRSTPARPRPSPPSGDTVSVHLVEALGRRAGGARARGHRADGALGARRRQSCRPARRRPPPSGCSPAGRSSARGALPPERCVEPEAMFAELERRGCTFEVDELREAVRA